MNAEIGAASVFRSSGLASFGIFYFLYTLGGAIGISCWLPGAALDGLAGVFL